MNKDNELLALKENIKCKNNFYMKIKNANVIGIDNENFLYRRIDKSNNYSNSDTLELVDITYNHTSNPDYLSNGDIFYQCFTCFTIVPNLLIAVASSITSKSTSLESMLK